MGAPSRLEPIITQPPAMNPTRHLVPFALAAFLGFLAIGIPLPVLPLYVHNTLGFGTIAVGATIGVQSFATLLSRQFAGRMCDERGPKRATLLGLAAAMVAGLCYIAADYSQSGPAIALAILVCGRLLLGVGESLFITALAAWSVARVGVANAGRAMAWSGMAMYGAVAVGAPMGSLVYDAAGFRTVAACAIGFPAVAFFLVACWANLPVASRPRASFLGVLRRIWVLGLAMALASSGVGTLSAFLALQYNAYGWAHVGTALAGFGLAYILVRLAIGGLPDRIGGFKTALLSLAIEALGLITIGTASSPAMALAGAILTGLGYSLIFPSLGVEAMRRVSTDNRGLVLGAYLACFDLGIAAAGPIAGVAANAFGLPAVFPTATAAVVIALILTVKSQRDAAQPISP